MARMPELCIVVPTFNEADNVRPLVEALDRALAGRRFEVIFVDDDSPDGTAARVQDLARERTDIRCIRRVGRRGLSSACVEGMLATHADYLAVIDADLQHDERLLPRMLDMLKNGDCDVVVGSRYLDNGSERGGLSPLRAAGSRLATRLGKSVFRQHLTDPMSGFFMLRRGVFDNAVDRLYGKGFKILLDIISAHDGRLRIAELEYRMRPRASGDSKLDHWVVADFLLMLLSKKVRGVVPARFFLFVLVGLLGVGVHMLGLYAAYSLLGQSFPGAQALATWLAMTSNFFLNNSFTFRDRKLTGVAVWRGLLSFYLACSLGALINVALASFLFDLGAHWALAGLVGAGIGAVWNFALSSWLTWRSVPD